MSENTTLLPVSDINSDPATMQARERLSREVIAEYAELYMSGEQLPPIRVVRVDDTNWLVDGFHRLAAQKKLGFEEVHAIVTEGTFADALREAAGANTTHGLRRNKGDALRAALIGIRALMEMQGSTPGKRRRRPTVDQVVEIAHVGRSTVDQAFAFLEASGTDVGEKDTRGRKKKETERTTETKTRTESTSGGDAPEDEFVNPETGEELSGTALVIAQAERRMQDVNELMVKIHANLHALNPADYEDENSDVRLNWEAIATTLSYLADEIRSTIGTPVASEPDAETPADDAEPTEASAA